MSDSYSQTRDRLENYFGGTASDNWAQLTSDEPVSRIRQTVREGRDRMRQVLLANVPEDLSGARVLDAGCGVGQISRELARRGATVMAVDLAESLLNVAMDRTPEDLANRIHYVSADMLSPRLGRFDHVVAMDSLIHYAPDDIVGALSELARRTSHSILFTVAPRTPALAAMHTIGKLFPRSDRSPSIYPIADARLRQGLRRSQDLESWTLSPTEIVKSGFYFSQAMRLDR